MTTKQAAEQWPTDQGPSDRTEEGVGDVFSDAFNGEPTVQMDPYTRLVPPAGEDVASEWPLPGGVTHRSARHMWFQPHDVERREYRLLARALTNEDDVTDSRAAMTLVQLVKFLRAAGVSVPDFPDTPNTPDPGST